MSMFTLVKMPHCWKSRQGSIMVSVSELVGEVFQWNPENIQSQLPLEISHLLSFTLALNGVSDYLVPKNSSKGW